MIGVANQEPADILSQDYAEGYAVDKQDREDDQAIYEPEYSFWKLMATQTYLLEQKHILEAEGGRGTPEYKQLAQEIVNVNQLLWQ